MENNSKTRSVIHYVMSACSYINQIEQVVTDIWYACSLMSSMTRSDPCPTRYSRTISACKVKRKCVVETPAVHYTGIMEKTNSFVALFRRM